MSFVTPVRRRNKKSSRRRSSSSSDASKMKKQESVRSYCSPEIKKIATKNVPDNTKCTVLARPTKRARLITSPKKKAKKRCKINKNSTISDWLKNNIPLRDNLNVSKNAKRDNTYQNSCFAKYGMPIPTFQEMLQEQKSYDVYKKCLEDIHAREATFKRPKFRESLETLENKRQRLNCKSLTLEEIEIAFKKNLDYITDIYHGKVYSERHERYKNEDVRDKFTTNDLTYNTSMIVFTIEQKRLLSNMMSRRFDVSLRETQYYFKVLLPELCLKIFMDTHKMSHEEAVRYLDD